MHRGTARWRGGRRRRGDNMEDHRTHNTLHFGFWNFDGISCIFIIHTVLLKKNSDKYYHNFMILVTNDMYD
eukprot:m.297069 g.297069  ORF g.297069 m.297069 type:complete len:71 (-) comp16396_c0_seq4:1477-1689(-)